MKDDHPVPHVPQVTTCSQLPANALQQLLERYAIQVHSVDNGESIPGSFWGDSEAGLVDNRLYVRADTPVHSALHEACHYICMDKARREHLHTDAGGGYDEENGVCYLQILLADFLPGMDRNSIMQDMDSWGYSFRLGSTRAWFDKDASDAVDWLIRYGLIDHHHQPTWKLRA